MRKQYAKKGGTPRGDGSTLTRCAETLRRTTTIEKRVGRQHRLPVDVERKIVEPEHEYSVAARSYDIAHTKSLHVYGLRRTKSALKHDCGLSHIPRLEDIGWSSHLVHYLCKIHIASITKALLL